MMKPAFGYCTTRDRMGTETFAKVTALGAKHEAPLVTVAERADDDQVFIFGWRETPSAVDRDLAKNALAAEISDGRYHDIVEWVP